MIAPSQDILVPAPVSPANPSPTTIAQALTGRGYLSYSQISTFQACPLKWWLSYVEDAPAEQVSSALVLGGGVHAAIQTYLEAKMALDTLPTLEELMLVFDRHWQQEVDQTPVHWGKGEDYSTLQQTVRQILQCFLASPYAQPAGQIVGIEETLRIKLAQDLPDLLAVVDLIEHRDGELIVTDFKTARSMWTPQTAWEQAEQLMLYSQAAAPLAQELDAVVKLQYVVMTKTKNARIEHFEIPVDAHRVQRSRQIVRRVFGAMQSGHVYPAPSPLNCTTCPYQTRCQSWHEDFKEESS